MDALREKYSTLSIEELSKKIEEIEEEKRYLDSLYQEECRKIEEKEMENISRIIPEYTKKLERLKLYIDEFHTHREHSEITYKFKHVSGYYDDWHDRTKDPLEWMIAEYDILGMYRNMEIIFLYSNIGLYNFIRSWIDENMNYMQYRTSTHLLPKE